MFGPTHYLRELSSVIAASSAADGTPEEHLFLLRGQNREGFDTIKGCEYAYYLVFMETSARHGEKEARRILAMYLEPSPERLREIKKRGPARPG
jgi:hypothetical protein